MQTRLAGIVAREIHALCPRDGSGIILGQTMVHALD
jgi:hypothetical protein